MLSNKTAQGDVASAGKLLKSLSKLKTQGVDVDNEVQRFMANIKPIKSSNGQAYGHLATKARELQTEAFIMMNTLLKEGGLTWHDLGYLVLISESRKNTIILLPEQP